MIGIDAPQVFKEGFCMTEQENILCTALFRENEILNRYVRHGSRKAEYQLLSRKYREVIRKVFYLPTYLDQKSRCGETKLPLELEADF